jgi:hypothetical protein
LAGQIVFGGTDRGQFGFQVCFQSSCYQTILGFALSNWRRARSAS